MQENWISACVKDSHLEGMHLLYSQSEKNMLLLQTKYKKIYEFDSTLPLAPFTNMD